MRATLVALDGQGDIAIDRVLLVIGRHPRCDARLPSARVSRRHCCVALDCHGVLVRDLGSTNGTWVNGHRVEVGVLKPGDELRVAQVRFRLVIDAEGVPPAGPLSPPPPGSRPDPPVAEDTPTRFHP